MVLDWQVVVWVTFDIFPDLAHITTSALDRPVLAQATETLETVRAKHELL